MRATNKRLTVLSEEEQEALYGLPDFDDEQRIQYLQLTEGEVILVMKRRTLSEKIYCALQFGYFKAKERFFDFVWEDTSEEDLLFILETYFPNELWISEPVGRHEYYQQRKIIRDYFGYQNWNASLHENHLMEQLNLIIKRDISIAFILPEILSWLKTQKIIRPGYTTLQLLVSNALNNERHRLCLLIRQQITAEIQVHLDNLLVTDTLLSELAALKQDAKDFKYRVMQTERDKIRILKPIYQFASDLLPALSISQQNTHYYADLANYYTVYELRQLQTELTYLYLLCYGWTRYQQLTDNVADAFCYHIKHFDDELKSTLREQRLLAYQQQQPQSKKVGRLLGLFADERFDDQTPFRLIREEAFSILPKEEIHALAEKYARQGQSDLELRWQLFDRNGYRFRKHLRPLFLQLDFSSQIDGRWIQIIQLARKRLNNQQPFPDRDNQLIEIIPKRLRPFLLVNEDGHIKIHTERYEYWLYRQCRKQLLAGSLNLEDSTRHRSIERELLSKNAELAATNVLNLPRLKTPVRNILKELCEELNQLWRIFNRKLKQGEFQHLHYDRERKTLVIKKVQLMDNIQKQEAFYNQIAPHNIINVLQFVNERASFLKAFHPLLQRYSKKLPVNGELFAVMMAEAMGYGLNSMADICNIPYHTLQHNYKQFFRDGTLSEANNVLVNAISELGIYPHYELGFDKRYGSVDGQKYSVEHPTTKARHSKKYFGKGRGVVAYTLLCNHVPLQTSTISAHDHESYYVFDIAHHNTSSINPEAISGDMHSINKANFAILDWFGYLFTPRFTDLSTEIEHVHSGADEQLHSKFLIKPAGKIDQDLIEEEWPNLRRIMVTLAQKEITQSILMKKLCTYSYSNRTKKALFEYDRLIRSIYTLKYIMDPKLQRQIQRSQNRIEAYHQLRSAIAQVGGKKKLSGKTDIEVEISNQCGRLIANAIIYYNSIILSTLLEIYQANNDKQGLSILSKTSPVAWRHIYLTGHYFFDNINSGIDLLAVLSNMLLDETTTD